MTEYWKQCGFYWRPLGGNNIDQISGHCYQYTDIRESGGKSEATTIIVDLGKFDNHQALGIKNSAAAVPDIREILHSRELNLKALFITHSHPDHLNGIIHYLKAGYALPPLFGGKYTRMILEELYDEFDVPSAARPEFIQIDDGSVWEIGSLKIEVLSSSHTCFDSYGLILFSRDGTLYHTGDMKIDGSTYFRKPTNIKRLKELSGQIGCVVADFCGITEDGFAYREADTYKKLVSIIKKSGKKKIFIPVYPTHAEMYIIPFLAALKAGKNVVFYGDKDFFGYLKLIIDYGISFEKLAGKRIRVLFGPREELHSLNGNFAVIGTFNDIGNYFDATPQNSLGIVTARTFFNPLRGQFNSRNIPFVDVKNVPVLQGYGHGFLGDYEYLNTLLKQPLFIPTHCPRFIVDSFRELAEYIGMEIIRPTPQNNNLFKICGKQCSLVKTVPATWLVVDYGNGDAHFTEVWQKPTSGEGFLKRTFSARRCKNKFKMLLHKRQTKGFEHGFKKIR